MSDFSDYLRRRNLQRLIDEAAAAARLVHSYEGQISRLLRTYELGASTSALAKTIQDVSNAARLYDQAHRDQLHRLAPSAMADLSVAQRILEESSLQSALRDRSYCQFALEVSRDLLQTYRNLAAANLVSLPQKLSDEAGRLQDLLRVEYLPAYQLAHQIVLDSVARSARAIVAAESLASQFARHLDAVEWAETTEEREALLEEFVEWWSRLLSALRPSSSTVWNLLNIFITLFLFAYQKWNPDQMEARLSKKILDSERRIISRIEALRPVEPRRLLIISRRLRLHDGPSVKEKTIRVLNPGVVVEELDRQDNWVFVECFDVATGEQNTGWVYGKYLRPIPLAESRQ